MYFRSLLKSTYSFKDRGIENIPSIDIMKRFIFVDDDDVSNSFMYYDVQDGETPEMIAEKIYGSPYWYWLILLYNDITDTFNEYTRRESYVTETALKDLGDRKVFYIEDEADVKRKIEVGDILILATAAFAPFFSCDDDVISAQVVDVDHSLNKYVVYTQNESDGCPISTFKTGSLGKVVVITKSDDQILSIAYKGTIRRIDSLEESVTSFENDKQDKVSSKTFSPESGTGKDPLALASVTRNYQDADLNETLIGDYMGADGANNFDLYGNYEALTFLDFLRRDNNEKRRIKIPHPIIKNKIQQELSSVLKKPSFDSDVLIKNN